MCVVYTSNSLGFTPILGGPDITSHQGTTECGYLFSNIKLKKILHDKIVI